jgi:hypothetical protein
MFIGSECWVSPFLDLARGKGRSGPGIFITAQSALSNYIGPLRSSSGDDVTATAKSQKQQQQQQKQDASAAVYDVSTRRLLSPVLWFAQLFACVVAQFLSGLGDVSPALCQSGFIVVLLVTVPTALLVFAVRPYIVPSRNVVLIMLETSILLSGAIFASVVFGESDSSSSSSNPPPQAAMVAGQLLATLPGAILGPLLLALRATQFALTRVARIRVVPSSALLDSPTQPRRDFGADEKFAALELQLVANVLPRRHQQQQHQQQTPHPSRNQSQDHARRSAPAPRQLHFEREGIDANRHRNHRHQHSHHPSNAPQQQNSRHRSAHPRAATPTISGSNTAAKPQRVDPMRALEAKLRREEAIDLL